MKNEPLERPSLKQFVSTKATTKDINSMFLNNTELYNYITALDAYCDYLESKLCEGKLDSDTGSGLHKQSSGSMMDYYEFLSDVTGVDADYMKKRGNILRFKITDVVMFLETLHEKLNEKIRESDK